MKTSSNKLTIRRRAAKAWSGRITGLLAASLFSVLALAGPVHDKLPMTGIADQWLLGREFYIGALYLQQAPKTPEEAMAMAGPKRMELRITNDKWSARQWGEMWNQMININNSGKDELKGLTDDVIGFTNLLKDALTYGDRVTIDFTPKAGVDIAVNGTVLYKSRNDRFFNALLKAWVGARPPSSDFKRNIITLPADAEGKELIDRYAVVVPEGNRKTDVAAWVKQPEPPKVVEKPAPKPTPKPEPKPVIAAPVPVPVPVPAAVPTPKPTVPVPAPVVAAKPAPVPAAPVPATPAPAKPVQVAKAAPPPPAPVAAAPAATAPASDAGRLDGLRNIYRANMLRLTYRHVIYPASALSKNQEGAVIMRVTVNRNGKVTNIAPEKLSEFAALNKAAEKAVKKASPFPAVPAQLPGDKFEFNIPIKFRIPT